MNTDYNDLEARLRTMFNEATVSVDASPDLFARVTLSVEQRAARRRERRRIGFAAAAVAVAFVLVGAFATLSSPEPTRPTPNRWHMNWWILELLTTLLLCVLAVALGPLIKRFGKAYAADVFRANPRTGKSYIVLTDVAYYLIFGAYILFTITFELPGNWTAETISPAQIRTEVARIGGIMLIIGALHSANIVMLPAIGRLFSLNRRLEGPTPTAAAPVAQRSVRTTGPGASEGVVVRSGGAAWILRIEPFEGDVPEPDSQPDAPGV